MLLTVIRGDNQSWRFRLLIDGVARDITGDFIRFSVKTDPDDADTVALIRKSTTTTGVAIVLPQSGDTKGMFDVSVIPSDSTSRTKGQRAYWDVQFTLANGDILTPIYGDLVFVGDVTKNTGAISGDA